MHKNESNSSNYKWNENFTGNLTHVKGFLMNHSMPTLFNTVVDVTDARCTIGLNICMAYNEHIKNYGYSYHSNTPIERLPLIHKWLLKLGLRVTNKGVLIALAHPNLNIIFMQRGFSNGSWRSALRSHWGVELAGTRKFSNNLSVKTIFIPIQYVQYVYNQYLRDNNFTWEIEEE
jgi:hypothetical protein